MKKRFSFPLLLLIATSLSSVAQTTSSTTIPDPPATQSLPAPGTHIFPGAKEQFNNYLYYTFGPPALIRTAVAAALDQSKPAPPEWDPGTKGYAERYGSRFGMSLVSQTSKYAMGSLIHEDVAFHRCECRGFLPRSFHALTSTFTAKTPGGRTIASIPALVSPYVGSFTAINAWYPARYQPADALRVGSISFAFSAVGNLVGEFLAPRR